LSKQNGHSARASLLPVWRVERLIQLTQVKHTGIKMIKVCINCGESFSASHDWKTYCIPCFIKVQKAKEYEPAPHQVIDDEMLMRLIRLCHPDRHQNSEASHKATVFLLSLREEQKGEQK
jgi:ribosomal protein S27AE